MPMHRPRFALPLCLLSGLAWTAPALGAGFSTARFGGEHGNPITNNPTAVYYNPAGIADSEGIHVFLDGTLAFRSATYAHAPAPTDDTSLEGANSGEATLFNVAAAPMLGASAKIGDLALGLGVYVPFGGATAWDKNEAFDDTLENGQKRTGAEDGIQRWHAIEGSLLETYFTLAAAYKIPSIGLSLGVSGNLIRSTVQTLRARNASADNTLAVEGRSLLDVSGIEASFGVGALFEAMPKKLWIGASYTSRPNITGEETLEGTLKNRLVGQSSSPVDIALHQGFPDIARLGVRFVPKEGLELRLFGDFTRWSAMENQCLTDVGKECKITRKENEVGDGGSADIKWPNIARRWNDAFGVRAGLSYWPAPTAELFAGIGYDSNAIPDETLDPSVVDFDDIGVAVGGRFPIVKQLHLAASYTHLFYIDRDTTGKSISATKLSQPSVNPDSGGQYGQTTGVLNVNLDVAF
jgi:long-chain fatty acid transport protein